jgi:hypothetical protein
MSTPNKRGKTRPKDRSQYPSTADWATTPNEERKRPMVTLTFSPEGLAELDRMRGDTPRGAYIEQLLDKQKSRKKVT